MRRAKNIKREVRPDPVYGSLLISKFTNRLMVGGKKSTAYRVLLDAMEEIKKVKKGEDPLKVLELAINNISSAKKGKPMAQKLAEELLLATKNEGAAIKKKLDTHRMAEANKAFAHFAW